MRALRMSSVVALLSLSGCSLISASGLEECQTSADCGSDKVCTEGLCLPQPTGCGTVYGIQEPGAIAMGALFPVHSGTSADAPIDESDEQGLNATVLALDQINQRGLSGKHFTLYYCDTGNDANRARLQAAWLVKEKKVSAVITAGSGQTLAVAQSVTIGANVVTMSYSATSPEITPLQDTNGGPVGLVWRTSPSDSIQGTVIANLLRTDTRFGSPKRVGILYLNEPYGQGLYNIVNEQLAAGTGITSQGFSYTRGDIRAAMDALNTFDPDLTVLVGFASDVTSILTDAANRSNLNRTVHKWLFSDSVKDRAVLANPNSVAYAQAQGFYGTAPAQGAGQAFNAFRSSFRSKYNNTDPSEYAYTSNAYDAMYLLALGAAYSQGTTGSVTGPKLAEGLTKLSATQNAATQLTSTNFTTLATELAAGRSVNVDGASGALDFNNDTGEAPAPVELWRVNGGNFETVSTIPAPK